MNTAQAMSSPAVQPVAGAGKTQLGVDHLQGTDAWQQAIQHQQQQQQTPYYQTFNTTPAPFNTEHVGGLSPLVRGTTGHYDLPAGSTSQGPASPLVAPGDLEAGPPSIDQVWGMVYKLQQQVTQSH